MLRELLAILSGKNSPMAEIGDMFNQMLTYARENNLVAGRIYFEGTGSPEIRTALYEKDREINKLQRKIRKRVVAHLSLSQSNRDVPYCLLMMSLIKDVERLGDYAKNLSEVADITTLPLPDSPQLQELAEIRRGVEKLFGICDIVLSKGDVNLAMEHLPTGKALAHRCDALVTQVAQAGYDSALTTALVLGARYYKRVGGHTMNLLSSVVMPLHKVDYYDKGAFPTGS